MDTNMNVLIVALLVVVLIGWLNERGKRRLLQDVMWNRNEALHRQSSGGTGFLILLFVIGFVFILFLNSLHP